MFEPPQTADLATLDRMHSALGISNVVLVQGSSYGADHSAIRHALEGPNPRYRVGVGIVDQTLTEDELRRIDTAGIKGARFHDLPWLDMHLPIEELIEQADRVSPLGWHLVLHVMGDYLVEHEERLSALDIPVVIDHMCHLDLAMGLNQPAMKTIGRLLQQDNWWIRLSNGDRISRQEQGFDDVFPLVRALVDVAPERALWGTDWPHAYYKKTRMPADSELLELFYAAVPDLELQRQILVENPTKLYGPGVRITSAGA